MRRIKGVVVTLIVVLVAMGRFVPSWAKDVPTDLLLAPVTMDRADLERYRQSEKTKIQYLLTRLRKSDYVFIRNGTKYPAMRAAKHLRRKYLFVKMRFKRLKTAREFIDYVAAQSSISGEPYFIKTPENKQYFLRDILHNELNFLEASTH